MQELARKITENIGKVIIGKEKETELICCALFAGGSVLIEDVPGTGKTKLANALAASIDGEFKRIQFTPDLLPGDLTGVTYFSPKDSEFIFRRGAVFTNILLADEINRATPRTQSALLEAMEEKQVTVDGTTYPLNMPFFTIATQNPIESQGTYPLPEAQLDRFWIKLTLGYPQKDEYIKIVNDSQSVVIRSVCSKDDIIAVQEECQKVYIHDDLIGYIAEIAQRSRKLEGVRLGLSTRAVVVTAQLAKAYAYIQGRKHVIPEDIKYLLPFTACHRLILMGAFRHKQDFALECIQSLLSATDVPTEKWTVN